MNNAWWLIFEIVKLIHATRGAVIQWFRWTATAASNENRHANNQGPRYALART